MNKKIAIQLFGHLRTFEHTFESFKKNVLGPNISDNYEIDIFIHTWNEIDHKTVNYRNQNEETLTSVELPKEYLDKVHMLYNPKKLLIDSQKDIEELIISEKIGNFKRSVKGCLNVAYTLYKGSELRRNYALENGITYDFVIVTRPDIYFKKPFRLKEFFSVHNQLNLPIPAEKGLFYAFNPFGRGNGIEEPQMITGSDLIYFAKPENVDKATSLYENFEDNIDINNFYCMEHWWYTYWIKQGLTPYAIKYRHVSEFEVIQNMQAFEKLGDENPYKKNTEQENKKRNFKYYKRKFIKFILSLFPYFLVQSKIKKIKRKLEQ